jgi:hypothetical protein
MSTTIYKGILSFDKIGVMEAIFYIVFKEINLLTYMHEIR